MRHQDEPVTTQQSPRSTPRQSLGIAVVFGEMTAVFDLVSEGIAKICKATAIVGLASVRNAALSVMASALF